MVENTCRRIFQHKTPIELEQLYNSESRTKLLEIERKYDLHALKREYDNYRHQGTITLLSALAIVCALGILSWGIWKYLQKKKEELQKKTGVEFNTKDSIKIH